MNSEPLFSPSVTLTDCDPVDKRDTCFIFMKAMNTLSTTGKRIGMLSLLVLAYN